MNLSESTKLINNLHLNIFSDVSKIITFSEHWLLSHIPCHILKTCLRILSGNHRLRLVRHSQKLHLIILFIGILEFLSLRKSKLKTDKIVFMGILEILLLNQNGWS